MFEQDETVTNDLPLVKTVILRLSILEIERTECRSVSHQGRQRSQCAKKLWRPMCSRSRA